MPRLPRSVLLCALLWPLAAGAADVPWLFAEDFDTDLEAFAREGSSDGQPPEKRLTVTEAAAVPTPGRPDRALEVFFPRADLGNASMAKRVELRLDQASTLHPFGTERWYAWSLYVPEDYGFAGSEIVQQFHGIPDRHPQVGDPFNCTCDVDCDQWRSPPLMFRFDEGRRWDFLIRWSSQRYNCDGNASTQTYRTWAVPEAPQLQLGSWTHWVLQIVWDPRADGQGVVRAWIKDHAHPQGTRVIDYSGPTGFNDAVAPNLKLGIYHHEGTRDWPATVPSKTLYFDRLRIAPADQRPKDLFP